MNNPSHGVLVPIDARASLARLEGVAANDGHPQGVVLGMDGP